MKADNDKLTHIDENGKAQMVDVGSKEDTDRSATASGKVLMSIETIEALKKQELQKGDVLGVARVAGIQAAKKTSDLIPLCHPLAINFASVDFIIKESHVEIEATVKTFWENRCRDGSPDSLCCCCIDYLRHV